MEVCKFFRLHLIDHNYNMPLRHELMPKNKTSKATREREREKEKFVKTKLDICRLIPNLILPLNVSYDDRAPPNVSCPIC